METTKLNVREGLLAHFPFPSIRPAQVAALEAIANSLESGKSVTVIEAPTGSGKSPIGMAAALWSASLEKEEGAGFQRGAHYLTSQNSLSTQLLGDFEPQGLVTIKGIANYACVEHGGLNCELGAVLNGGKSCSVCTYRQAKNAYIYSSVGVSNYTYYFAERKYVGDLPTREILVLDEAHNIEREILGMVEIEITSHRSLELGAGKLPIFEDGNEAAVRWWLSNAFLPAAQREYFKLEQEVAGLAGSGSSSSVLTALTKRLRALSTLITNIGSFCGEDENVNWFAWSTKEGSLTVRPLSAASYVDRHLLDRQPHTIMMSATILDMATFARSLGLSRPKTSTFSIPSDFPAAHRRVVVWPVGSMSAKQIDATLPRLAERTAAILTKFATEKGIIHTHSYKINNYLYEALKDSQHGPRLRTHTSERGEREAAIAAHLNSPEPTVLMSPSMTEGLDLKNESSRFQVICKVPYPYLDAYMRERIDRDPQWYQLQTALTLIQATGRSVRSVEDHALTVILDADARRFITQNQSILPPWWLDAVEFR